ncbi:MAG: GNAT family N-acetyltransferase [Armatimonadota bacterium]|nr:GNAT family N-acetyltransferase [Armatimonadota bacterium]MCX7777844.1 GNAT family N-acetyltransferase [Armatimonadota bacterium]MDW8025836.1 GNAT family N-acetyltransferase [Armatimonadota bacterium]
MSTIKVRGYRCEDEMRLISLWNEAMPYDSIDERTFRRKVLLDPNFDPSWLLVAEVDDELVGFCLCLVRRVPMEKVGLEKERGWITAFGVLSGYRRRGIGKALIEHALSLFEGAGKREVLVSPYTPNYFIPGVDEEHYSNAISLLSSFGFEAVSSAVSAEANISTLDFGHLIGYEEKVSKFGVCVRAIHPHEIPKLMQFLREHMPGDWVRHARELLIKATYGLCDYDQFVIAERDNEVLGYCQFDGEHFGPIGVREDAQGMGIGSALMLRCLQIMRSKGLHNAWMLWTSQELVERFYSRFGFRVARRFCILAWRRN